MFWKLQPGRVSDASFKFLVANGGADRDDFKWKSGPKKFRREIRNKGILPHVPHPPLHLPQFFLHLHRFSQET